MALNVDNIIGLSVAHGIDITTALIVILTYVGHGAYFWLFEKFASVWNFLITKVFCCGLSSRWIIRRQFLKDSSMSGSYAKTSLYLMLHICLVFNAVRVAGSAFHVARYSITTNYDFSKPPSEQVLTRKVHILNSIQNALFVVGLFLYSVIFSILILIWLQVVRTLQDLYDPKDHRSFGVIHHSVVKVLLVIVLSIEAVFVVPAIVTYSVPRQKLVDKRVIDWVVAYTCGPVFGLCIIFLITLATVLGVRILYLTYRANKNSASTESSESKRVLITKISISLIVFMITMIIQLVGVVLNGLGLPVWSTILFLQSLRGNLKSRKGNLMRSKPEKQ